jgi:hypothetical protein
VCIKDALTVLSGKIGILLLCAFGLMSTGCTITATQKPVVLSPLAISENSPTRDVAVYLREISDSREFTTSANLPSTQSVVTVDDLDDIEIGSVIGQWRTSSSDVLADLLLEDSNRVTTLVGSAIEEGFRRADYEVVSADRAVSENAIAIDGQIHRFWTYQTGSWTFRFTFEIEVELQGDVADLEEGRLIETSEFLRSAVAGRPASFGNTIDLGMEKFIEALASELR